jgi:lipopolysaccharide transport system permease protein
MTSFKSIWLYRDFILGSVKREFRSKFQNSVLGTFWILLNPLAMIFVYTVVFSHLMKAKLPSLTGSFSYSIYLCIGILSWGLFSEITTRALTLFLDNANLLKKIHFPKLCLSIILLMNAWINFAIIFSVFILFLKFSGNFPGWIFLAVIPIFLIISLLALALGLALGILNVFYRDIGQVYVVFLQFWFWLTPIVYTIDILPSNVQVLLRLNPMSPMIEALHKIAVYRQLPEWDTLLFPLMTTLLLAWWAASLYRRHMNDVMDEL